MPDLATFDLEKCTVSIQCAACRWKFRCPIEQLRRVMCSACESRFDAKETAQAK
jgi:hypothetical protein